MKLRPALRRAAVVAALVTVTAPLAACGDGNTRSWVGTFCGTGSSLRTVLLDANAQLKSQLAANASPARIKASVVADASRIAAAAASSTNRIRGAGDPTVDEGHGVELAAIALYEGIEAQANVLPMEAGGISDTDAGALTAGIGPYSTQVADLGKRLRDSFTSLESYKGYAKIEKMSRTSDPETHVDETCAKLQAPAE